MITVSERDLSRIEEILSRPEPGRDITWRLSIEEEDLSNAIDNSSQLLLRSQGPGPANVLDGFIAAKVPEDMEGSDVMLHVSVGGFELQRFGGVLLLPKQLRAGTILGAASGGAFGPSTELGTFMQFSNHRPDTVCYQVLSLLPYDLSEVSIAPCPTPPFTRSGAEGFSFTSDVTEVMDEVMQEAGLTWSDNFSGGTRIYKEPPLNRGVEPVWTFEVGRDIDTEDEDNFQVEREADRFRNVVVSRKRVNPALTEDPNQLLARVEVPGSRAPRRTRFLIELSEDAVTSDGYPRAVEEADLLARRHSLTFKPKVFHPLLERGDVVAVVEPGRDERGRFRKTWACVLQQDQITLPVKTGVYGGPAEILQVERVTRTLAELGLAPG